MGCDIHVFIEKRLRPQDEWQLDENHTYNREYPDEQGYLGQVSATSRNYNLFGILANVRAGGAIYLRRGIPDNASEAIKHESKRPDWHSHSWLTLKEFKKCLIKAGYDFIRNKSTEAFYEYSNYPGGYEAMPEDYTTVVNYCEEWIANELAEAQLLNRIDVEPEIRLIFWFDN